MLAPVMCERCWRHVAATSAWGVQLRLCADCLRVLREQDRRDDYEAGVPGARRPEGD